jgi:two-component system, NarL family, invasion response regulator UvrY
MNKILLADHNAIVRRGMREILNEATSMQVLGEACDSKTLLECLEAEEWGVLLLDIALPGRHGLDLIKQIKVQYPKLPIVVFGKATDVHLAPRALKAGALVYLSKDGPPGEITKGIWKAIRGEKYLCAELAQHMALANIEETETLTPDLLSDRELQVMLMISRGCTLKEIAYELCVSEKTVATYRTRILEKMRMRHNADMIRYALENKLITSF